MAANDDRHHDDVTGTDTTGHEWDGIRELDTPLPRWWLWVFYATIVWALGYAIAMPAVPLIDSATPGVLGFTERGRVAAELKAVEESRAGLRARLTAASPSEARADSELLAFARAGGRSAFAVNCSQCHGSGAEGRPGYPNLNDDDWLWGGTPEAIHDSIRFGIRSEHDEARGGDMPGFLTDEVLERAEIDAVTEYVLSLSGQGTDTSLAEAGKPLFAEHCTACHGDAGTGNKELGAPNLADAIWLHGADKAALARTIARGRKGVMPAWEGRLDDVTLKQLALYIHTLGGGE